MDEAQAAVKTAGRNINNLRYADDTTLTAESKESERGEWKVGLKLNIQKTKIMASGASTSWHVDRETVVDFILLGSKITAEGDCSHKIKDFCCLEEKLWPT